MKSLFVPPPPLTLRCSRGHLWARDPHLKPDLWTTHVSGNSTETAFQTTLRTIIPRHSVSRCHPTWKMEPDFYAPGAAFSTNTVETKKHMKFVFQLWSHRILNSQDQALFWPGKRINFKRHQAFSGHIDRYSSSSSLKQKLNWEFSIQTEESTTLKEVWPQKRSKAPGLRTRYLPQNKKALVWASLIRLICLTEQV